MVNRLLQTISVLTLMAAGSAAAVELGDLTLVSGGATGDASGESTPFEVRIDIHDVGNLTASQLQISVADVDAYQTLALERNAALDSLSANITSTGDAEAPLQVVLRSSLPINAPFVPLVVDTQWPGGRLLTEYTVRLQTPDFSSAQAVTIVEPARQVELDVPEPEQAELPSAGETADTEQQQVTTDTSQQTTPAQIATQDTASSSSATPDLSAMAETITVESGDTLWELALEVRPNNSVSVQQTMLALQELNPDAFINNNINRVQRGAVLRVPALEDIRQIGQQNAIDEVRRQNQSAGASTAQVSSPVSGNAAGDTQGELRVVSVDEQNDQEVDPQAAGSQDAERNRRLNELEDRLAVRQEEVDRLESENNELNARLSMLQQQIASAQEIIRLRDLELAQLQENLAEQREQEVSQTVTEPAETSEPETEQTVVTMAPDPGPIQRMLNTMQQNPLLFIGGIVLAIAVLVLLLAARNRAARKRDQEASAESDQTLMADKENDLVFTEADSNADEAPEDDAKVTDQADTDPESQDDFDADEDSFAADREESDFEALLNAEATEDDEVEEANDTEPDDFEDPENDWADPLADLDLDEEQDPESEANDTEGEGDSKAPTSLYDESVVLDDNTDISQLVDEEESATDADDSVQGDEDVLDPETDLSWPDDADTESDLDPDVDTESEMDMPDEFDISIADEAPDTAGNEDLDTELDVESVLAEDDVAKDPLDQDQLEVEVPVDEAIENADDPRQDTTFDEEVSLVDQQPEVAELSAKEEPSAEQDLSAKEEPSAGEVPSAEEEPSADQPASDNEAPTQKDDHYADELEDLAFISTAESLEDEEDEDPDFPFLTDSDESASKLDLARAYIDMGDIEGAKEILAEVIDEGRDDQREDARKLLERL